MLTLNFPSASLYASSDAADGFSKISISSLFSFSLAIAKREILSDENSMASRS